MSVGCRWAAGEEIGELGLQDAELVAPGVAHHPEVVVTFFLVVPARRTERFQTATSASPEIDNEITVVTTWHGAKDRPAGARPMRSFSRPDCVGASGDQILRSSPQILPTQLRDDQTAWSRSESKRSD